MFKHIPILVASSVLLLSSTSFAGEYKPNQSEFVNHYGTAALNRLHALNNVIKHFDNAADASKVATVNNYLNAFSYVSDQLLWGKVDYWEQPLQFIGLGGGDCEDFALAKYATLLKMGVPANHMKLDYVRKLPDNTEHMVLLYSDSSDTPIKDWNVLDNTTNDMKKLSDRKDLLTVYAFNYDTLLKLPTDPQTNVSREMLVKFYDFTHHKNILPAPENPFLKFIDKAN